MKVVTFGEIMLRLAPNGNLRFSQMGDQLQATFGGGEANVAVSLSNFGINTSFVTKLPSHEIGQCAINEVRKFGVDTKHISRGGNRVGIYYLEKGASQRASNVIYDRAGSSICTSQKEDFNWEEIFKDVNWFHFTGITPALNSTVADICLDACKKAKELGIKISCDLNYRKKLWTTKEAGETMASLMEYVDICIANEEDAEKVFNIKSSGTKVEEGNLNHQGYVDVAKQLIEKFNFEKVAITLRTSFSASENNWAAMLYDGKDAYFSKEYNLKIVDRVGGGDSFAAGLIYSLLNDYCAQEAIEFAVAASALKHAIEGDFNRVSVEEVQVLANGDGSGRVQR